MAENLLPALDEQVAIGRARSRTAEEIAETRWRCFERPRRFERPHVPFAASDHLAWGESSIRHGRCYSIVVSAE